MVKNSPKHHLQLLVSDRYMSFMRTGFSQLQNRMAYRLVQLLNWQFKAHAKACKKLNVAPNSTTSKYIENHSKIM